MKTESKEQIYFDALKRISKYASPENLRFTAEKAYGVSPDEAIQMAYENVIHEAKCTIRNQRRPKSMHYPTGSETGNRKFKPSSGFIV